MQLLALLILSNVCAGVYCYSNTFIRRMQSQLAVKIKETFRPILPGTLWCGPGTLAKSYEDLGLFRGTDKCCRDHDNCPENIYSGESKYGLKNQSPFTLSHCDCDEKFRSCLRDVLKRTKSPIALETAVIYFNTLGPQCFKQEYPIARCMERLPGLRQRCMTYELNTTLPKRWQFFDGKFF